MIFNKALKGSEELKEILGSYYLNNDFGKIKSDIDLAEGELIKVIGQETFDALQAVYTDDKPIEEKEHTESLFYLQFAVGILATMNMYRQNDISHEDTGRKVKIDANAEKIPWEWQLKRDDEIQLDRYYMAVDRLIAKLEKSELEAWLASEQRKTANSLFIKNAWEFDLHFPINQSGRMYMLLLPFIKEAQRKYIKPALGTDYTKYLNNTALTPDEKEIRELILPAIPLLAMSIAVKRMQLGLIPAGVIRNYIANSGGDASNPATMTDVRTISRMLYDEGMDMLNDMKKLRNAENAVEEILIPVNSADNKYMRV